MRTPSTSRMLKVGIGVFYVVFFLYSLLVLRQLLYGLVVPALLIGSGYLAWRVWRVFRLHEEKLEAEAETAKTVQETPVDRLKRRYAEGELSEEEFEAQLEQVMETEDSAATADTHSETVKELN